MILQRLYKHTAGRKVVCLCLSALTGLLCSCGNNGCEETRESYLLVQLKSTHGLTLNSLTAWGLTDNGDSLAISQTGSPTEIELTLQPDSTYTQILLQCIASELGERSQYDSKLHIWYKGEPYFLDMECGCTMHYQIDSARIETLKRNTTIELGNDTLFHACTIKNKNITNEENINIILEY